MSSCLVFKALLGHSHDKSEPSGEPKGDLMGKQSLKIYSEPAGEQCA